MKKSVLCVLIIIGFAAIATADLIPVPFQSCSAAGSAFNAEKAFISQTPKAGVTEEITLQGTANSDFSFADAQVTATVLGITVLNQKVTLSGSYKAGDAVTAVASLVIPSWAPAATATVYVRAHDGTGKELACGQATITITKSALTNEDLVLLPNDLIPVPFQSCSAAGSSFNPEKAFISETPKAGVTEQITIQGVANAAFTFADAQVTATVLGITVLNQKVTLSGSYKAGDAVSAVASLQIPSWAPSATATVYVRIHDPSGAELACGQAQITIQSTVSITEFLQLNAANDLIPVPFQSCSAAGSAFNPEKAFISVTPKAGVTEQITIQGVANAAFTFADAQVTATVLGITVLNQKVTLSGSYKAGDAVTAVASLQIPSWAPSATATVYVRAHDLSGAELACGQAQITIQSTVSVAEFLQLNTANDLIPVPFQSCSAAGSAFNPEKAFISVTPKAGVTEQITIQGVANAAFTFADAQVTATVLGITVLNQKVTLSGSYKAGDAVTAVASLQIPSWAPSATATVYVRAHDPSGAELACGQAQITIQSSVSKKDFIFKNLPAIVKKHKKQFGDNIPLPFTNCGTSTDALNVQNVYITQPLAKGITEGVIIDGSARSTFTLSQAVAKVKFLGITVATQTFSFSNSYNAGDAVSISLSISIPSFAPSGSYVIDVTATDSNGNQVACGTVNIKISSTAYETPVPWPYSNCGGSSDPISVTNLTLSDTPAKGVDENIVVNGVANTALTLNNAAVSVSYLGINIYTGNVPLSGSFVAGDPITINYNVTVPSLSPSGTYTITIKVTDPSGSQLSCDKTTVKI